QQKSASDLTTRQQTLETTRQQLAAAADSTARAQLQQKEFQQGVELQRATQQAQLEIQTLQREVNADMQQRVRAILDDLLKTQGYQVVLNMESSVIWSAPDLDLTAAVVGRMNGQQ